MEKEKNKRRGSMQTKTCRTLRDDRNACDFRSDCLGILAFTYVDFTTSPCGHGLICIARRWL
jgi:hypothetical protein